MQYCSALRILVHRHNARWRKAALSAVAVSAIGIAALALHAASDPIIDLKTGADALDAGRYPAAISALKGLPQRLPKLADYAAWFLASAQSASKDYAAVPATLHGIQANSAVAAGGSRGTAGGGRVYPEQRSDGGSGTVAQILFGPFAAQG